MKTYTLGQCKLVEMHLNADKHTYGMITFYVLFQNPKHLNYLTSEQALADFAVLIQYLKQTIPGAVNSSVVAFGGSYGGMLSAWMRIKYPNIVMG